MKLKFMATVALSLATCISLSGCAGWVERNYQKRATKECTKAGYSQDDPNQPGCVSTTAAALKAQAAQIERDSWGNAALATALVGAYYGAKGQAEANAAQRSRYSSPSSPSNNISMCPDGSYINGTQCYIAPDGSYVNGSPRMAPNGRYVGSNGNVIPCPDGSYVNGSTCLLAPNGTYVGGW